MENPSGVKNEDSINNYQNSNVRNISSHPFVNVIS